MGPRTGLALLALAGAGCSAGGKSIGVGPAASTTSLSATSSPATTGVTIVTPSKGGTAPSAGSPILPPPTAAKPAPITRSPVLGVIQLTAADSTGTFDVRVGQSVELTLSTVGQQWGSVNDTPTGLLARQPAPAPPLHGQLVIWKAAKPGGVTLSATGVAYCAAGTACPAYAVLFKVILAIS